MSIGAFFDVPLADQDMAVEIAVAMAEVCLFKHETLYLLADATTALEIGISLVGSRESRTVEGGEYRASPLVLLPFIPRPDSPDDRLLASEPDLDVGGGIDELHELGLFARRGEGSADFNFGDDPSLALQQVISRQAPAMLLGLGETSRYWRAVGRGLETAPKSYRPQIITVEGFGRSPFGGDTFIHRPEPVSIRRRLAEAEFEMDEMEAARRKAEHDGALIAALFQHLTG